MTRYKYQLAQPNLETFSRQWEVQRAPYKAPLGFKFTSRKETQYPNAYYPGYQVNDEVYLYSQINDDDLSALDRVSNRARVSAVNGMKGERGAALGLTLLDWKKSLSTIVGAGKSLIDKAARKRLYYRKRSSELFLEGVFGWVPLITDIYDACNTLTGAHRSSPVTRRVKDQYSTSISTANFNGVVSCDIGVQVGGLGRMDNPNLALMNDLGLLNPAAVAWDKVPYSFVVNWFIPVGTYLESLTDLVGYSVQHGYSTRFVRKTASGAIRVYDYELEDYIWRERYVRQLFIERSPSFPSMTLPQFQLPSADLFKSLVTLSLLDINLRKLTKPLKNRRGNYDYTE